MPSTSFASSHDHPSQPTPPPPIPTPAASPPAAASTRPRRLSVRVIGGQLLVTRAVVLACSVIGALASAVAAGCGPTPVTAPDAAVDVSTIPRTPEGTFTVTGQLDLATLPPPADQILVDLAAATDGPDDPARYLVDRVIAGLPDGTWKSLAQGVAPFVAPYIQSELAELAPRFGPGLRSIAAGLGSLAHHMGTLETLEIAHDGGTVRTLRSMQLGTATIALRDEGLADAVAITRTNLDPRGTLAIGTHAVTLPYGRLLRLGLDRAVIPSVDPNVSDLSRALSDLVDCKRLGTSFATHAGIGWPGLYEAACTAGLTALANSIYDRMTLIDATPFQLTVNGTARGVDHDGDGTMDSITDGTWNGTTSYASISGPLGTATFEGLRR